MYPKIPAIVTPSSDAEGWAAALFESKIPAAHQRARSERKTFAKDLQRNAGHCSTESAPIPQGEERGQDETEGEEVRAGHQGQALPAHPQHDGGRIQERGAVLLDSQRAGRS